MITILLSSLVSALLFAGIWRMILGPQRPPVTVRINLFADLATLERIGREMRERDEVESLERMIR